MESIYNTAQTRGYTNVFLLHVYEDEKWKCLLKSKLLYKEKVVWVGGVFECNRQRVANPVQRQLVAAFTLRCRAHIKDNTWNYLTDVLVR